jgi:hypothetical protein
VVRSVRLANNATTRDKTEQEDGKFEDCSSLDPSRLPVDLSSRSGTHGQLEPSQGLGWGVLPHDGVEGFEERQVTHP